MTTSAAPSLYDRFRQWPRAMQWAAIAVAALALFLLWDSVLSAWTNSLRASADALQSQAAEVRKAESVAAKMRAMSSEVAGLGPVDLPKASAIGAAELQDAVLEFLKSYSVSDPQLDLRTKGRLPPGTLASVTPKRLDRLTIDLKFISTPEDATAIIAAFESAPVIAAVNSVRLVKDANRKVKVNLTIEAWIESAEAGRATR